MYEISPKLQDLVPYQGRAATQKGKKKQSGLELNEKTKEEQEEEEEEEEIMLLWKSYEIVRRIYGPGDMAASLLWRQSLKPWHATRTYPETSEDLGIELNVMDGDFRDIYMDYMGERIQREN